MIWVLIAHLHFHAPGGETDIWSITNEKNVYVRQDACEAVKEQINQLNAAARVPLDLECRQMAVVE